MTEQLSVTTERVDDIPLWLAHILSEGDHRMNQVQAWAAHRMQTLSICTGQEISERSWIYNRLALVLDALSDEQKWQHFETALNRQIIRMYNLKHKRIRVDKYHREQLLDGE